MYITISILDFKLSNQTKLSQEQENTEEIRTELLNTHRDTDKVPTEYNRKKKILIRIAKL